MNTGEHLAPATLAEKLDACRQHLQSGIVWKGEKLGILEMRRHYGPYFAGLPHIKPFRSRLVTSENLQEILEILQEIEVHYSKEENMTAAPVIKPTYAGLDG